MSDTRGQSPERATTCAQLSADLAEPLTGTSAVVSTWLCVEQPGPWGAQVPRESHMPDEIGTALTEASAANGVRLQLIRTPGAHPDRHDHARTVLLAHTTPGRSWLRRAEVRDVAEILDLDWAAAARGDLESWGTPVTEPLLLVCTHGKRDRCCAVHGRALANAVATRHPGSVWETSHTGGHRFAPAAVLLPTGYTYGRVSELEAEAALTAARADRVSLPGCRGRSTWSRAGQAAELAVRAQDDFAADALLVAVDEPSEQRYEVRVEHRDGREWSVTVVERDLFPARANSCGKSPSTPTMLEVVELRRVSSNFSRAQPPP